MAQPNNLPIINGLIWPLELYDYLHATDDTVYRNRLLTHMVQQIQSNVFEIDDEVISKRRTQLTWITRLALEMNHEDAYLELTYHTVSPIPRESKESEDWTQLFELINKLNSPLITATSLQFFHNDDTGDHEDMWRDELNFLIETVDGLISEAVPGISYQRRSRALKSIIRLLSNQSSLETRSENLKRFFKECWVSFVENPNMPQKRRERVQLFLDRLDSANFGNMKEHALRNLLDETLFSEEDGPASKYFFSSLKM
jgi:hypothetical protein